MKPFGVLGLLRPWCIACIVSAAAASVESLSRGASTSASFVVMAYALVPSAFGAALANALQLLRPDHAAGPAAVFGRVLMRHAAPLATVAFAIASELVVVYEATSQVEHRGEATQRLVPAAAGALSVALVLATAFALRRLPWPQAVRHSGPMLALGASAAVLMLSVLGLAYAEPDFFLALSLPSVLYLGVLLAAPSLGAGALGRAPSRALLFSGALSLCALSGLWLRPANAADRRWVRRYTLLAELLPLTTGKLASELPTHEACTVDGPAIPPRLSARASASAPDIVLITVDALRWDRTSLSSPNKGDTPQLARLAKRGVVFERAYTPAPSTRHAFRSMFSGLYPGQVPAPKAPEHAWALTFAPSQTTLAELLVSAGYETIAIVASNHAFPEGTGALDGFRVVDDRAREVRREHSLTSETVLDHLTERVLAPRTKPRFIWTHLLETHYPYSSPYALRNPRGLTERERHRKAIAYIDGVLGRAIRKLLPRLQTNTWLLLGADHGEAFREHGNIRHGSSMYEEEVRVPLIAWGPSVVPGVRHGPVSLISLFKTVVDLAGLGDVPGACGTSLRQAITSAAEPGASPVFVAHVPDATRKYFKVAWIDGTHKLIADYNDDTLELYDLARDPGEQRDLWNPKDAVGSRLQRALSAHLRKGDFGFGLPGER